MRSVPGILMNGVGSRATVRCRCGAELRTLGPGEAIVGRGPVVQGSIREEEVACASCGTAIRLRIATEGR